MRQALSWSIHALGGAIGVLAFVYPFLLPALPSGGVAVAHAHDAPLVTTVLVGLALAALVVELQGQAVAAKTIAVLGVLVAVASVLRFVALTIPGLGGISPIFTPIILAGYVFGARFGFLMGAFSLLVSALVTGGVGPWLPYQMFTAGWIGMSAGWLGWLLAGRGRSRLEVPLLAGLGFVWGLLFGAIMNVYFWPFAAGAPEQSWAIGSGVGDALRRYALFYVATSLWWDTARGVGNVVLILLVGAPMVRALSRFRRRFDVEVGSSRA